MVVAGLMKNSRHSGTLALMSAPDLKMNNAGVGDPAAVHESVAGRSVSAEPGGGKSPERRPPEIGGPAGPDPTRFGDWERGGRCIDF
jgi:hypothetical protein